MYTGNYLVSPQLLWSQGIRVSHCLSCKIWFMCLMTPSSQSIIKNSPTLKLLSSHSLNWTVSWWNSLPAAGTHHSLTVLITQLTSEKCSAISWPFPHVCTTHSPAACCQVCVPKTHWSPPSAGFSNENNASPRTLKPCLDVLTRSDHGFSLPSAALWIWVLLWADVSWFLFSTCSYCAGWHFASALTRQLDMRSSH